MEISDECIHEGSRGDPLVTQVNVSLVNKPRNGGVMKDITNKLGRIPPTHLVCPFTGRRGQMVFG